MSAGDDSFTRVEKAHAPPQVSEKHGSYWHHPLIGGKRKWTKRISANVTAQVDGGAADVGALEGLYDSRRGDRRLSGADLVRCADRRFAGGVGGDARTPGRLSALPLCIASDFLHDDRFRGHLAVPDTRPQRARKKDREGFPDTAGALGNRHRRGGRIGAH